MGLRDHPETTAKLCQARVKFRPRPFNSTNRSSSPRRPPVSLKFVKYSCLFLTKPILAGEPISSAVVKYNYQAQQLDELSLVKGARILILEKSGDGWWRGQYGNKVGWFPSNYTQEELEDAHTYCMAENVLDIMVALYTFKVNQNRTRNRYLICSVCTAK